MSSPIPSIISWSRRRRVVIVAAAICLGAAAALAMRGVTFDTDVLSLLPRGGHVVPAFRSFVQSFGSADDLYVVFTAPEGHDIREYEDEVESWVARLRAFPGIERLDTGQLDRSRDMTWFADRRLLLLETDQLEQAIARLNGEQTVEALRARRALLSVPAPGVADLVRHDPLGIYDLLQRQLGKAAGATRGAPLNALGDGYISSDSRSRLLIAKPARPPFEAEFSRSLMSRLEALRTQLEPSTGAAEERPALDVQFAGGHRIAVETEAVIRRESIMNAAGSLALILPLLFIVFRSFWLVGIGAIPSALSLILTLGLLGLTGATLSAAATASGAMLFGLGVDGVVLLYVAYTLAVREGAPPVLAIDGLAGPAASMLLGMWTTAATFYGLRFVDFPSLEQLGTLIGHSMVLCGVLTLVLVPALLPRRAPAAPRRSLSMPRFASWVHRQSRWILVIAGVLTLLLGAAALRLRVNPTLDRLRSVTPGAAFLQQIAPMFGLPEDVYVVVASGADLEALLQSNEELRAELARAAPDIAIQAPSMLLPSMRTQERRQQAIHASRVTPEEAIRSLAAAASSEGFRPGAFDPFKERLPALLDPASRLTYDGFARHGLADLLERFVIREGDRWLLASYLFPAHSQHIHLLERRLAEMPGAGTLTGLPLVNSELARRFVPEFAKGLAIGSLVVIALVVLAFRDWRLSLLSLAPTALGLVWAAGVLALAGVTLDLFALFAVVTFVGIGVDYGVHMVHRYRERGNSGRAVEELAPVILVAGAITLLGYGTLIMSSYPPLRSIGLVSTVSIVTLVAASLFVLPAILARRVPESAGQPAGPEAVEPRRWTLHGLNNGLIFTATYYGVRILPRRVSYGIGHVGTWIAWKTMAATREALVDNLRPLFPDETEYALEQRALQTLRSYALDVVDFLRAISARSEEARQLFVHAGERPLLERLLAGERGIILVTGHYGNWEIGSILLRQALEMPLTIVAMPEPSPTVNRLRRRIREQLGAETIEVRQSFDTPLQIRRCLAANRMVAMLVDRHIGKDRVAVTLLGRDAWFLRTPFLMAHATGAPLLPCFIERIEAGRFKTGIARPVFVATDIPREQALQRAAQEVADALSARVRQRPDLWYQFYKYWEAQREYRD